MPWFSEFLFKIIIIQKNKIKKTRKIVHNNILVPGLTVLQSNSTGGQNFKFKVPFCIL